MLNKCDLVDEATLRAREALLAELSPGTAVVRAVHGDVDGELLFPVGPRGSGTRPEAAHGGDEHDAHPHARFLAEEVAPPQGLSDGEMHAWLSARAGYRTKGFVRTLEGVRVVQGVGRRLELLPRGELEVGPDLVGRVVTIRARS